MSRKASPTPAYGTCKFRYVKSNKTTYALDEGDVEAAVFDEAEVFP